MNILGISAYYHDSAACLVRDGVVLAAAQEERFTRKKHDDALPTNAVEWCLKSTGSDEQGLDAVVFYDKPIDKFARILMTHFAVAPGSLRTFLKAVPKWIRQNLWVPYEITEMLESMGVSAPEKVYFTEHHEAHAAAAFFASPYPEAAILTLDGVGEWPTSTIGMGRGNRIELLREQDFPHSLGLLYSAFTYYLGFKVNGDEYKVMGLAPYGEPRYRDLVLDRLVSLHDDGSFRLDMQYFDYLGGLRMTNEKFDALFGEPPRQPGDPLTAHHMDVARSIQEVTEEIVARMAAEAKRVTGASRLCLAGGVALNCVANGKLLRSGDWDGIWAAPAAHDGGGALGAALAVWYQLLGNERVADGQHDAMQGSALGPSFGDAEIEALLEAEGVPYRRVEEAERAATIARLLDDGGIVGLFQGRMEFGPRALGCRSILADPRSTAVPDRINRGIKFRESFRPFAPAVLDEYKQDYFGLDAPSPYMLFAVPVAEGHRRPEAADDPSRPLPERLARERSDVPAVTHVDYSARVQTVSKETNPRFHALIDAFRELTGCPVVVNTSFNVRGEPIVCTPREAYRCFMKTGMDHLVLESYLLSKDQM